MMAQIMWYGPRKCLLEVSLVGKDVWMFNVPKIPPFADVNRDGTMQLM